MAVIVLQGLFVFSQGELLFVEHQLLDRVQRVGHVGHPKALGAGEVVDGAALLHRLAPADAVLDHARQEGQRAALGVGLVDGVVGIDQQAEHVVHLGLVGVIELLKALHILHLAGADGDLLALVHSVGEHQLQRAAHVEERGVMPTLGFAGLLGLHTADDVVIPGVLQGEPAAEQRRNDDFVVVIGGQTDAGAGELGGLDHEVMGRAVPNAHRQRGLRKGHMHGGLDAHEGKVVGGVQPVFVLAAGDQVLEQTVAREALGRGRVPCLV